MTSLLSDHSLDPRRVDAVVLDLDGVITDTARTHAAAWKAMFDEYLARRGDDQPPFDPDQDYRRHVDGKPRYDGVRDFLAARGIELPWGDPDDPPDRDTVCGLGNRKNALFRDKLASDGVDVYPASVAFVEALRRAGVATAVVSSSRNCAAVLEAAGIAGLFDARVDGRELARLKLPGKPAPDMFLEAARRLASEPARTVGVEDAAAGVAAARAAGFGTVVGVDRGGQAEALRRHGAHLVVGDLAELEVGPGAVPAARLPVALEHLDHILPADGRRLALFLDYDGTLTPIVERPEDAVLADSMRRTLERLAELRVVAVISGRDLEDVRRRVAIDGIWYAGSHGFDIAGPGGEQAQLQEGRDHLPELDAAEARLHEALDDVPGCQVERKRFSIAIHYRRVAEADAAEVKATVEAVHGDHPGLRLSRGKKVLELQPDIHWHKGRALRWLMDTLGLEPARSAPLYIGDDVTDEDAFRELAGDGVAIVVAAGDQPSRAHYRLPDPAAVEAFLGRLVERLEQSA